MKIKKFWPASLAILAIIATGIVAFTSSGVSAATTYSETTGGVANTWTNYTNAGGTAGPQIAAHAAVQIACKVTGFKVADGNTWWYQIASAPWNNGFYVSADAFYNNGATSGSLTGTPFVDPAVPDCTGSSGGSTSSPTVTLAQGPAAPAGYRYAITLSGFSPNSAVAIGCYDSVSPNTFYHFSLTTNASGYAYTASYCYSGDGPDHWVLAAFSNSLVESNHVTWGGGSSGGGNGGGGGSGGSSSKLGYFALGDSYSSGEGNPPFLASGGSCDRTDKAWPYVVGRTDPTLQWVGSYACSGATTADIPIQLAGLVSYASRVNLITVTIGGNDAQFKAVLQDCYLKHWPRHNCVSDGTLARASTRIRGLVPALTHTYRLIQFVDGAAHLVVVGYPRIFPATQSSAVGCGWLSNDMRNDLNILTDELNYSISKAAAAVGASFVSTSGVMAGHELCTRDSWFNPIEPNPFDRRAAHPLVPGQNAMAAAVVSGFGRLGF